MRPLNAGRNRGVSLISMLVGLVLSLIAIVSMMSVYKVLITRGIDIRMNAKQDAQVSTALIATNLDIQKAGYGVEAKPSCVSSTTQGPSAAANTDLVLLTNAALSTPLTISSTLTGTFQSIATTATAGSAVIWHWVDPSLGDLCAGLVATQGTLSPRRGGGLVRLAPMPCVDATKWNTLTWSVDHLIADDSLPREEAAILTTPNKAVTFSALRGSCTPFAVGAATPAVLLTIKAGNSTMDATSSTTLCLTNICR